MLHPQTARWILIKCGISACSDSYRTCLTCIYFGLVAVLSEDSGELFGSLKSGSFVFSLVTVKSSRNILPAVRIISEFLLVSPVTTVHVSKEHSTVGSVRVVGGIRPLLLDDRSICSSTGMSRIPLNSPPVCRNHTALYWLIKHITTTGDAVWGGNCCAVLCIELTKWTHSGEILQRSACSLHRS